MSVLDAIYLKFSEFLRRLLNRFHKLRLEKTLNKVQKYSNQRVGRKYDANSRIIQRY